MSHPLCTVAFPDDAAAEAVAETTKGHTVERDKALEMALASIDKQFGKGSIRRMGEKGSMNIETIPTGALALDIALGVGGQR